jgi:hypothetical protein
LRAPRPWRRCSRGSTCGCSCSACAMLWCAALCKRSRHPTSSPSVKTLSRSLMPRTPPRSWPSLPPPSPSPPSPRPPSRRRLP